ncbi:related to c2h2 transcriptional regulator [Ceraceosorus bombacis]|uniref:Related to c2h2 transcriptional regulator n=1 Tax=Ceraceosorus bombacis TaxID=401625 RepID=A0A0P1B8Y9_9BASI|nr:related to c2h2 transcriptional regulator [Ceraceosorus bombacis]
MSRITRRRPVGKVEGGADSGFAEPLPPASAGYAPYDHDQLDPNLGGADYPHNAGGYGAPPGEYSSNGASHLPGHSFSDASVAQRGHTSPDDENSHAGYYGSNSYDGSRGQHLPPLAQALDGSAHDGTTRYQGNGSHAGGSYDAEPTSFDSHIMNPSDGSAATISASHDYSNGHGSAVHHTSSQYQSGPASSAGVMTPPPPGSSHGGSTHGYYQQPPAHMLHRASISGPVMSHHYSHAAPTAAAPVSGSASFSSMGAPPHAGDMAAWGNASGSARPHTADGMFGGPFGLGPQGWTGAIPSNYNRGPRASISSVSSMNEGSPTSGGGKIFSYMVGGDESAGGPGGHGSNHKKRPRRRYDEIERLYNCSFPGCAKSYGTLNHLNAHVAMQKHGAKRTPGEFKEMRKAWRKGKREEESRRQAAVPTHGDDLLRSGVPSAGFSGAPGSMQHVYPSGSGLAYQGAPGGSSMGSISGHQPRYSAPHAGSSFMSPPSNGARSGRAITERVALRPGTGTSFFNYALLSICFEKLERDRNTHGLD